MSTYLYGAFDCMFFIMSRTRFRVNLELVDLNMDILDYRIITGKHLGREVLHLNKTDSTCLVKNIISMS